MRRTLGEIARFFPFAVRDVAVFFAAVDLRGAAFAPDWSGSVFAGGVLGAVGDCLSGESEVDGLEDCCGRAIESAL